MSGDRVLLVGADDVARAGHSISAAGDQMQRAAGYIDESLSRHAARLEDVQLRAEQMQEAGATLRDEFAMRALPSVVLMCSGDSGVTNKVAYFAQRAYELADAMLKARGA